MNCCTNCFESEYLNEIIISNKKKGNCDYCESLDVFIYEVSELNPFFRGIISLYEIENINGKPFQEQILIDFPLKVFTQKLINTNKIIKLVTDTIKDDIADYQHILDNNVQLKFFSKLTDEKSNSLLSLSWDNFSKEIKSVNRFHLDNPLELETIKSLFEHFKRPYKKGKKFFRARINKSSEPYSDKEMGNPPPKYAKAGRANPNGISYLYLANQIQTTLYEVRATLLDYVTVGTFALKEDIVVINISRSTYDVFRLAELESLEEVMLQHIFIDKLEEEISKPRSRNDSELDYLPTQYISELIKSMKIDGIEYKSSLSPNGGYNIAIFNPDKFKCIGTQNFYINDIKYSIEEV